MPVIDLGGDLDHEPDRQFAASRLLAHVFFPDDPKLRRAVEASFTAEMAEAAGAAVKEEEHTIKRDLVKSEYRDMIDGLALFDPAKWFRDTLFTRLTEPLGGLKALTGSPSVADLEKQMNDALPDVSAVASLLSIIASMDAHHRPADPRHGASIKKAEHILCRRAEDGLNRRRKSQGLTTLNFSSLKKARREYWPVAHLCVAYLMTETLLGADGTEPPQVYTEEGFWLFGAIAQRYQDFATSFVPMGQKRPLIDPDTIHRLPEGLFESVAPLWESELATVGIDIIEPLDDAALAALASYKAPEPY